MRIAPVGAAHRVLVELVQHSGASPASFLDPELDDRSVFDDRCVSEHRHDIGVADRGKRDAEGVERIRHLFREESGVCAEPSAQELAECVRLLDRLGARRVR